MTMTYDAVNPSHYRGDRKFEPIEVIEDWNLNYRLGNALKYISRNGRKPGEDPREGLRKAIWYLQREIDSLEDTRPYSVEYEDVLDYYGQTRDLDEAWPQAQTVPFDGTEDVSIFWTDDEFDLYSTQFNPREDGLKGAGGTDVLSWDSDDNFMWDPTLGPIEVSEEEVGAILAKKDLKQFEDAEIVATVEKRGFILGIKKDGSTCELGGNGRCV